MLVAQEGEIRHIPVLKYYSLCTYSFEILVRGNQPQGWDSLCSKPSKNITVFVILICRIYLVWYASFSVCMHLIYTHAHTHTHTPPRLPVCICLPSCHGGPAPSCQGKQPSHIVSLTQAFSVFHSCSQAQMCVCPFTTVSAFCVLFSCLSTELVFHHQWHLGHGIHLW